MKKLILLLLYFSFLGFLSFGQTAWEVSFYPDEARFQQRITGKINALAEIPFGDKGMARSVCPDTGLPVKPYVLEGELVYSPYTGRAYRQGETGYFGPKERGADGRIEAIW